MFAVGRRQQVLGRAADDTGGEGGGDLHLAPLEELEKPLGVFLFLVGRLLEDARDLHEAFVAGLAGEVRVAVAGLRLADEGQQQVAFGLRTL